MRSNNWLILGVVLVLILALSIYSIVESNNLSITINTDGTSTNVNYQTFLVWTVPSEMEKEIKNKASGDVQSPNSTVDNIKSDIKSIASKYGYNANVNIFSQYGINQLPMAAKVKGTSMVPTLKDGQSILVLKTNNLTVGDIVVAIHPTYGLIVKRLSIIEVNQVYLTSDNKNIEIINTQTTLPNGSVETVTVEKTPLNTWLPTANVIGVVKVY
ncbi:S24 family peptidase [Methanobacterium spitsbergense]|uniref:S26 family signal peptidase n=1 Tax=Methanobacterium spitsbergense TaxID=2874285 RepID=A0A8T5UPZ9_9EURY|nr:S24 family peptidase [Methanobacterium spitsbergense]MBZ2166072.1 S26 family signal peptidase [Methanobacterium spitsbergense]